MHLRWLITTGILCCARLSAAAPSGLNGSLYTIDGHSIGWSAEQWRQEVAAINAAGLKHLIISGPSGTVLDDAHDRVRPAFERFLDACRGTPLRIYLTVWCNGQWYARWDLNEELDTNRKVIARLAERYAAHPNFAGWYIPHEIYVEWGEQARYIRDLYAGLSKLCKQATPKARVVLSPFFILDRDGYLGDFRYVEPPEYEAFWTDLLPATQIDVVALQDSGEHLSFYTMEQRRPFLAAMKRACQRAGRTLWVNVETGELDAANFTDYEAKFGRKTHVNDAKTREAWRVVTAEKLHDKLALAHAFSDTTITWGYQEYWDPMRGPAAAASYRRLTSQTPASSAE